MKLRRVLFVHDGPLLIDSEGWYYGVSFHNGLIERYTFFGDSVSFLMRKKSVPTAEKGNYNLIDHPAFQFIEIPDFKSIKTYFKKRVAKSIIEEAVKNHDVIIVRLPSAAGSIAFNHAKKYGKPVLVESVACVFDALWNYNWKGKLLAHFKYLQNRQLMKQATHTIYVTNEFLQSRYPSNGKSIGCSDVVLKEFDGDVLKRRIQKIKEREEGKPLVIGTVAALNVPYKGQADVIKAVGKLRKQGVKVIYKLVGQGSSFQLEKAIKESGVEDCVEIVGPLPHNNVFDFLDKIDIYIQPSRQEGLPRAMVEAMSRACFMMGANTAGIPELIEDQFVFDAGNIKQINEIILRVDQDLLVQQAKRNFNEAKKFQASELNSRRISFYNEFMNDHDIKY